MQRWTFKLSSLLLVFTASTVVWAGGRWACEELCIRENQHRLLSHGRPLLDRLLNDGQGEYRVCVFAGALVVADRLYGERLVEQISHGSHAAHLVLRQPNIVEVHFWRTDDAAGYEQYQITPERIELVHSSKWACPEAEMMRSEMSLSECSCSGCRGRDWQWSRY